MTEETPTMLCLGRCPRASRRSCAFCGNVVAVICGGERCIRPICDDHRWSAAEEFDLCPWCENKLCGAAGTAKQIELFG